MSSSFVPLRPAASDAGHTGRGTLMLGATTGLLGLLVVVAGSFLPWLTSGGVQRNSYAVLGIVRRLRLIDGGPTATAMSLWPLVGAAAMLPVVAGILRWWRTAAAATSVFGVLTGVVGALVLAVAGGHQAAGIALSATGPLTTVAGAMLSVVGAGLALVAVRRSRQVRIQPPTASGSESAEPAGDPVRPTAHSAALDRSPRHPPHRFQHSAASSTPVATERGYAG